MPEGLTARVLRTLPDGMASLTLEGRVRAANERLAELLGVRADRARGRRRSAASCRWTCSLRRASCATSSAACCRRTGAAVDVSISTLLHRDKRGRPGGLVLIVRDLREVVALRSRLLTSGRMAAVGELAAGIAHELNNPIAYVRANLSLLREHVETLRKEIPGGAPALEPRARRGRGDRRGVARGHGPRRGHRARRARVLARRQRRAAASRTCAI